MATKVFSDSRGGGLTMEIYRQSKVDLEVCHYPGLQIEDLQPCISGYTKYTQVSAAYIMVGVNNLTTLHEESNIYKVVHDSPEEIRDNLMDEYIQLIRYCKEECNIPHVVLCTLPGLDVGRYNKIGHRDEGQWIIDQGVNLLNSDIQTHNAANGYSSPMIHHYIHPTMGHARRARNTYSRLRDGLHPTTRTIEKWAKALITSMRLNAHF